MSEKMTCAGCGNPGVRPSRGAFLGDAPCPRCGLSADAAAEVLRARASAANADLQARYIALVVRADAAETRVRQLAGVVDTARAALEDVTTELPQPPYSAAEQLLDLIHAARGNRDYGRVGMLVHNRQIYGTERTVELDNARTLESDNE